MKTYAVIGAGGMGRDVMPLLRATVAKQDLERLFFVVEDHIEIEAPLVNGHPVLTLSDFLGLAGDKFYCIAIADSSARERISTEIPEDIALPVSVFAETFVSLDANEIGEGAIFANFTHVTSNVKIGRQFHCNIYSYVEHDVVIGDYVTFAPGVKCNGHVVIEDHAYLGAGAIIKNGADKPITIGEKAVVGMGAVVTKSVPPGVVVVGNPAMLQEK